MCNFFLLFCCNKRLYFVPVLYVKLGIFHVNSYSFGRAIDGENSTLPQNTQLTIFKLGDKCCKVNPQKKSDP